ncbi:MAG TPA: PEFG-CTERM sorting domain-containing protein [Nitrosopumilaceae archaeon]|nr:PEFG-CTERM sorting domain-containing protein [Nitrosopumilaceae archaeon]
MSTSFKGFALLAILVTAVGTVPAFAQSPLDTVPISVTTDKESYADGETIIISGETRDYISGVQLTISVTNPVGNRVYIDQIEVGTDKTYSAEITAGGSLWKAAGTYTVHVQYGGDNRANETTFEFSGSTGGPSGKTIKVVNTDFSVRYEITGGKVLGITADVEGISLLIEIETTSDGMLTIHLPRALIDAEITPGGEDDNYFVLVDGEESADFSEVETTSDERTLKIPFTDGATEIEIIGTFIVPEFGPIAALVLAVAIISIIAVSAKTRLRLMPKY